MKNLRVMRKKRRETALRVERCVSESEHHPKTTRKRVASEDFKHKFTKHGYEMVSRTDRSNISISRSAQCQHLLYAKSESRVLVFLFVVSSQCAVYLASLPRCAACDGHVTIMLSPVIHLMDRE